MYVSYWCLRTWYIVNLILLALSIWVLSWETFLNGQSCLAHKLPSFSIADLRKGRMSKRYSTLLGLIVLFKAVTKLLGLAWFDRIFWREDVVRRVLRWRTQLLSSKTILDPRSGATHGVTLPASPSQRDSRLLRKRSRIDSSNPVFTKIRMHGYLAVKDDGNGRWWWRWSMVFW